MTSGKSAEWSKVSRFILLFWARMSFYRLLARQCCQALIQMWDGGCLLKITSWCAHVWSEYWVLLKVLFCWSNLYWETPKFSLSLPHFQIMYSIFFFWSEMLFNIIVYIFKKIVTVSVFRVFLIYLLLYFKCIYLFLVFSQALHLPILLDTYYNLGLFAFISSASLIAAIEILKHFGTIFEFPVMRNPLQHCICCSNG